MALTDDQLKTIIIARVGDVDVNGAPVTSGGVIETNIDLLFAHHSGKPSRLKELYVQRDAIDLVLARLKNRVNTQLGNLQLSKSQAARALAQMKDALEKRIIVLERGVRAANSTISTIETTTPVSSDERAQFVTDIK